jgi:hypothetical protein
MDTSKLIVAEDFKSALSKARACAWTMNQLGESGFPNELQHALDHAPAETAEWLHSMAGEAFKAALDDVETAFRKSLTPEDDDKQPSPPAPTEPRRLHAVETGGA